MNPRLRVLVITNLFPNNADPAFAPFNRQQFAELGELADVDVFAVVPWRLARRTSRAKNQDVVRREWIDRLPVLHPRFFAIPGLPALNAGLVAASVVPELLWKMARSVRYDVVLGSYAYPDGCAAVMVGEMFRLPVVVKCHGSDLNRVPNDMAARVQMQVLLHRAASVVVMSRKLGERALELGVRAHQLKVVYNGVDAALFRPRDKMETRRRLGLPRDRDLVLYVGHLAEHKGAGDLLRAAELLRTEHPRATVVFVGEGPLGRELHNRAEEHGGTGNLLSIGHVDHAEVAEYMGACDLLCLPSWDEGMPNVVREAHASGRPVVATNVGGIPEAVHSLELGRLVPPKQPAALAAALREVLVEGPASPERILELAVVPTWAKSAAQLYEVLAKAAGR